MMASRRLILSALVVTPLGRAGPSRAQGARKVWRVGFLAAGTRPSSIDNDRIGGFVRGMRDLGYVEGTNLVIEWRFGDNDPQRLLELARELAKAGVDAILVAGVPPAIAAKRVTSTIPIVMGTATDPVGSGLVENLARPGGNITGLSNVSVETGPKHLQMLTEVLPDLRRVGVLLDLNTSSHASILKSIEGAARARDIVVIQEQVDRPEQLERALNRLMQERVVAFIKPLSPLLNQEAKQIAQLSLQRRLASVSGFYEYARLGGLMSYGQNLSSHYYRAASYVDKIFKGATPGDLPIEQPTALETALNRTTARALGISFPTSLLVRADFVVG